MKLLPGRSILVLSCLFLLILSSSAQALDASRIELKDGTTFTDVKYTVDQQYKILVITVDDQKRNASFTDVAAVYDRNGQDITADILGKYYQSDAETPEVDWVPEAEHPSQLLPKKPRSFGFKLGGNFSLPFGDYYEGITSGIGFDCDIIIPLTKNLAIRGIVSKSGMKNEEFVHIAGLDVVRDESDMNAWRYFIAAQYYNWPNWREDGRVFYYFYAGMGAIAHSWSGSVYVNDPLEPDGPLYVIEADISQTKFSMTNGGGVVLMMSKTIGIELGATLDVVFVGRTDDDWYTYDDVQYAYVFDFKVGFIAMF